MLSHIVSILDFLNVLNTLTVPTGNLGVSRSSMPQIEKRFLPEYLNWLETKDIKHKKIALPVKDIKLAQNEINKSKIIKIMKEIDKSKKLTDPIIISKDNFVIDGSHRLVAQLNHDKYSKIETIQIDMKAMDLLVLSRTFGKANFRTVSGAKIDV